MRVSSGHWRQSKICAWPISPSIILQSLPAERSAIFFGASPERPRHARRHVRRLFDFQLCDTPTMLRTSRAAHSFWRAENGEPAESMRVAAHPAKPARPQSAPRSMMSASCFAHSSPCRFGSWNSLQSSKNSSKLTYRELRAAHGCDSAICAGLQRNELGERR